MASILVVEDDPEFRGALVRGLAGAGHAVVAATEGLKALDLLVNTGSEVMLLDLGLPDVDGLQVLAMVRAVSNVPVIVITKRDDKATAVHALDAGADDYVVKPFGLEEITARIRAVVRRSAAGTAGERIVVGDLVVEPRTRTATLGGRLLELTRKEFDLLLALASRVGEVVTKRELLAEVWQQTYGGDDRTVYVHLSWLRSKLGETAARPRYLHTVRGVGVRLVEPGPPDGRYAPPLPLARGHEIRRRPDVGQGAVSAGSHGGRAPRGGEGRAAGPQRRRPVVRAGPGPGAQ